MELRHDRILILDFGSQYTQLIARRIREAASILRSFPALPPGKHRSVPSKGIILSGGPSSVYDRKAPRIPKEVFDLGVPILGICYGMQLVTHLLGGEVAKANHREYGRAELLIDDASDILKKLPARSRTVWMSHGDRIERMPKGFSAIAHTNNSPIAAMKSVEGQRNIYCLQFHPEVAHTVGGVQILKNFVYDVCGCEPTWTMSSYVDTAVKIIQERVGKGKVICALSGGVDSSVAAALTSRAVGSQLTCIFVDNGLLRKEERVRLKKFCATRLRPTHPGSIGSIPRRLKGCDQSRTQMKDHRPSFYQELRKRGQSVGQSRLSCPRHTVSRRH